MNLYNLHEDPHSLLYFKEADEYVLDVFWEKYLEKYRDGPKELKKREKYIATDAKYSYRYARSVLKGPFPAGEEAISKDPDYAYWYAEDVLAAPFPAGELAISKDAFYAFWYARRVLNGPFPTGEAVIAEDGEFSHRYAKDVLKADFYYDGKLIAKFES